jgi:hypothetical protein
MTRNEFVAHTVANTLSVYLQRYCSPWKIEDAQLRCLQDAEKFADKIFGVVEMREPEISGQAKPKRLR